MKTSNNESMFGITCVLCYYVKKTKNPNNYHAICKYFNMTISNSILLYFIRKYTQQRKKVNTFICSRYLLYLTITQQH